MKILTRKRRRHRVRQNRPKMFWPTPPDPSVLEFYRHCTDHRENTEAIKNYERERRAKTNYLNQATPFHRALCELEAQMPITFIQNPDGTPGEKIEHFNWPPWAIQRKKLLTEICEDIKKRCFEAVGLKING